MEQPISMPGRSRAILDDHLAVAQRVAETLLPAVDELVEELCARLGRGGKLVAFGNGGSAADAQHLAGELVGRFQARRRPLPAIALSVDPSVVTCIANDFGYDEVFARQVLAMVGPDDVVVGISTSGNSESVVRGLRAGNERGAYTVALTGGSGGVAAMAARQALIVPSPVTARIQEIHTLVVHIVSEAVDSWVERTPAPAIRRPIAAVEAPDADAEAATVDERATDWSGSAQVDEDPRSDGGHRQT